MAKKRSEMRVAAGLSLNIPGASSLIERVVQSAAREELERRVREGARNLAREEGKRAYQRLVPNLRRILQERLDKVAGKLVQDYVEKALRGAAIRKPHSY